MPGDQFVIEATVTSQFYTEYLDSNPGATTQVSDPSYLNSTELSFTVGSATATPGVFDIASVTGTVNAFSSGTELTINLSDALFNATTLGLTGEITGTFLGTGGGNHSYLLQLTDTPADTWTFYNDRLSAILPYTQVSSGTYSIAPVPEPSTFKLLIGCVLALLAVAGLRQFKNA